MVQDYIELYIGNNGINIIEKGANNKYVVSLERDDIVYCSTNNINFIDFTDIGIDHNADYNLTLYLSKYIGTEYKIMDVLKSYKKAVLICNLGNAIGSSLYVYISNLCKKMNISCDAIVSLPFRIEGNYISNAVEALNMGTVNNIFPIVGDTIYDKIPKDSMLSVAFNSLDYVFKESLKYYESQTANFGYVDKRDFYFYIARIKF